MITSVIKEKKKSYPNVPGPVRKSESFPKNPITWQQSSFHDGR